MLRMVIVCRMVRMQNYLAAAVLCYCAAALGATSVQARELAGVTMPDTATAGGKELVLNGMGVGKKFIFKVYVVGLYLAKPTKSAQVAITTDEPRRIELKMLRNVDRSAFVHAVEDGMKRNSGPDMPALRGRLDTLENALPALTKGNVLDFTWLPGTGTLMRAQGKELTIPGQDFADALFSVWLGPKAADSHLRDQLLGG